MKNAQVLNVLEYLKNGGIIIVGLHFPSFITRDNCNALFANLGVPWTYGSYYRTTLSFTPHSTLPDTIATQFIPRTYSMKCVYAQGTKPEERIYAPTEESYTESWVFAPEPADTTHAAAAGCKVGDGYLAYVGDVNAERGSAKLIEALCGVSVP